MIMIPWNFDQLESYFRVLLVDWFLNFIRLGSLLHLIFHLLCIALLHRTQDYISFSTSQCFVHFTFYNELNHDSKKYLIFLYSGKIQEVSWIENNFRGILYTNPGWFSTRFRLNNPGQHSLAVQEPTRASSRPGSPASSLGFIRVGQCFLVLISLCKHRLDWLSLE